MNKKIVVGCIGAAVIIVLASFTSAIGEQATKSSDKKDSPLFHIRTRRAINKQNCEIITSRYVGKGRIIPIPSPVLYDKRTQIKQFLDKIMEMTDEQFERFVNFAINRFGGKNSVDEQKISETLHILNVARDNPMTLKDLYKIEDDQSHSKFTSEMTIPGCPGCEPTVTSPLCFFWMFLSVIVLGLTLLIGIIFGITFLMECF